MFTERISVTVRISLNGEYNKIDGCLGSGIFNSMTIHSVKLLGNYTFDLLLYISCYVVLPLQKMDLIAAFLFAIMLIQCIAFMMLKLGILVLLMSIHYQ